jgi:hypothetical protein
MPGYSAHQFCRRTASSATPRTRAKANKEQPLSHAAGLHSPLTTRDWIGSYSAPLLPLWAPAPTPSCTFLEGTTTPTHGPSVSLVPSSINQSLSQPNPTRLSFSILVSRSAHTCTHIPSTMMGKSSSLLSLLTATAVLFTGASATLDPIVIKVCGHRNKTS